jgi:tetratricopeptide (TPR) repeat protein
VTSASSAAVERVWEKLRPRLALHDGFWLGYLFSSDLHIIDELRTRSTNYGRLQVRTTDSRQAARPGELVREMPWLLGEHSANLSLAWLIGVAGEPEPWRPAWSAFLRRLNERRDLLRQVLPGGLLMVCPPRLLGTVRESAPDLWSYRAMVVEATSAIPLPVPAPARTPAPEPAAAYPDLGWLVAAGPDTEPSRTIRPALRRAAAALQANHPADAVAAAQEALETAESAGDRALAHASLARALSARDDPVAAQVHARRALGYRLPLGHPVSDGLLEILAQSPDPGEILAARTAQVDIARLRAGWDDHSPESLRDLSISLDNIGDIQQAQGQLDNALTNYTESLQLRRQIHTTYGQTPQTLRDLSISLNNIGTIREAQGQFEQALASYREAEAVYGRLREVYGPPLASEDEWAKRVNAVARVSARLE